MYQLTIDGPAAGVMSRHSDFDDAHRALIRFVVGADYYLRPIDVGRPRTCYELLDLGDDDETVGRRRPPRTAGLAVIEELARTGPVDSH